MAFECSDSAKMSVKGRPVTHLVALIDIHLGCFADPSPGPIAIACSIVRRHRYTQDGLLECICGYRTFIRQAVYVDGQIVACIKVSTVL